MSVRFNEVIKQHVKVNYKVCGTDVEVRAFVHVCGCEYSLCMRACMWAPVFVCLYG